ncbi:hypothetical protein CPJCM30710_21320 [Clostridium polyendosporum]|uniref:ECF transporter S component n=1 Tax=Clostridium polyendosporum TaxID=69208 RepID=A0A919S017_9CLOT|nr:ECF transporter S component [Clostridium polyendosporum]GIM29466.1 hypothetical protein CPJCM30710_21320 [Clostridium polyendosporum]
MNKRTNDGLINLILTALMIAMVFLAGNIIKIPTVGGFVHIGDCMVFISAVLLGKKRGAIAAGIGMALVDIAGAYYIWAPFTFVIKAVMAYITGAILEKYKKRTASVYILSFITAGVFMVVGYFLAGAIIAAGLSADGLTGSFIGGLAIAAKDIVGNIIQVTTGIIIALPLSAVVLKAKKSVI